MIFTAFYLIVLLLVFVELRVVPEPRRLRTPRLPLWLVVSFLVVSYAIQLGIEAFAANSGARSLRLELPLPVVTRSMDLPTLVALLTIAIAASQSYALLVLYRAKQSVLPMALGLLLMLCASVAAPALTNGDAYAYVGNALLGAPPSVPFPGEFSVINKLWHLPMTPMTYGPLWPVVASLVSGAVPTLFGKLIAFRLYGAALLLCLLSILRSMGLPARIIGIVALNPAIHLEFVANAHNDLTAIVIVSLAAVLAGSAPFAAGALVATAGLVKLPYVVSGLPAPFLLRLVWPSPATDRLQLAIGLPLLCLPSGSSLPFRGLRAAYRIFAR